MRIKLPLAYLIDRRILKNPIRKVLRREESVEGTLAAPSEKERNGYVFETDQEEPLFLLLRGRQAPRRYRKVVRCPSVIGEETADLSHMSWIRHPDLLKDEVHFDDITSTTIDSWSRAFSYTRENPALGIVGLRRPQIGALHAIHAHWSVSDSIGTVVMPTGTGKTEVMLSVLVSTPCEKVLIVVPTDALRTQTVLKFLTLGILKEKGSPLLTSDALYPTVCSLEHVPSTPDDVDTVFSSSQVIVSTSKIVSMCGAEVQDRMAFHCPYLFIDEAHHAEAPTWKAFKKRFAKRRILQFTATPYREDGKVLDGEIIFKYSLKLAQEDGYFRTIRFTGVVEFDPDRSDRAIASKAIEQLKKDAGLGHILMARVDSVQRAAQVFEIYRRYSEFKPVQLHSGIKSPRERERLREQVREGKSRIVVCVDMLGEGFDLPELKIAAFHDIRKSLPVTLQLAGRFTRSRPGLGEATFIANTADVLVQDELRKLYARDPDWNALLPELSDSMIRDQLSLQEFLEGFAGLASEIPLKSLKPALSTVVYETSCLDWTPENFRKGIPNIDSYGQVHSALNQANHTLIIVTARRAQLDWTDVETVYSWAWELYVVVWSPEQNLLFINCSANAGEYIRLARAVAGDEVSLVHGQRVFRAFAGVNRLLLKNVGLTEQLGRNVRYTGRMGSDVGTAMSPEQRRRARKSVIAGTGFEGGARVTLGASRKGRIWSHRRETVDKLASWCNAIGAKLLDSSIDPDEVLRGTLEATTIDERPNKMPISCDWPEEIYQDWESKWHVSIGDTRYGIDEVSLELHEPATTGDLQISIVAENQRADYALSVFEQDGIPNYSFKTTDSDSAWIGREGQTSSLHCDEFFYRFPPVIWFADGSSLEGNQYIELKSLGPPYDASKIVAWDWTGTDLRKEPQGPDKDADSIQARIIEELVSQGFQVVFDDHSKGEAADVIALRLVGKAKSPTRIEIEFYHCKKPRKPNVGRRVEDLYEVCGQAQKSIWWMHSVEKQKDLFTHLLRREDRRARRSEPSRFELGTSAQLQAIREVSDSCPISLKVCIVQPGLSKSAASNDQLTLIGVTENYLLETYQIPFGVIGSA